MYDLNLNAKFKFNLKVKPGKLHTISISSQKNYLSSCHPQEVHKLYAIIIIHASIKRYMNNSYNSITYNNFLFRKCLPKQGALSNTD